MFRTIFFLILSVGEVCLGAGSDQVLGPIIAVQRTFQLSADDCLADKDFFYSRVAECTVNVLPPTTGDIDVGEAILPVGFPRPKVVFAMPDGKALTIYFFGTPRGYKVRPIPFINTLIVKRYIEAAMEQIGGQIKSVVYRIQ